MITVLLNMLCMLGWENGMIYVTIGYIFLTVPPGPTWDVCIAMGTDLQRCASRLRHSDSCLTNPQAAGLLKADGGHRSQPQEEPDCVTETSSIKKKKKVYFYCQNKRASRTSQWPDVPCAFIFCHCKRFSGTDKQVRKSS